MRSTVRKRESTAKVSKGFNRTQIHAVRHQCQGHLPSKFQENRGQFKPSAEEVTQFLSIEEQRLTATLSRLKTTMQTSSVDTTWSQSQGHSHLSTK
eukprot:3917715-Amphidinium_carterae.2